MESNEIISINGVVKEFKSKRKEAGFLGSIKSLVKPEYFSSRAVNDISFSVKSGEKVGFIGPNGAGKSTTIKMMSGILHPTKGEIKVLGYNPQKQRKKLAFHIGTVFGQKPQLWYHLPAIDTFNLFSHIYELDQKKFKKNLNSLVKLFEVGKIIHQPVRKLSLGQRMRCEIIASLLHNPKVLFLDEPTIGLDIVVKKKIRELIRTLNKQHNITVILTSHDMEDVEQICKRLIIINEGKIVYDGPTKKIRERFLNTKRITVVLENEVKKLNIKGVKTIFRGKFKHGLEVNTKKHSLREIVQKIMALHDVVDISVLDPPIEEIIEDIFLGKK